MLSQLFEQLVEPVAQRLLVLLQIAELLLALAALLVAALVLALLEGLVAQLLLLADHVAELVERRHHVVVALIAHRRPAARSADFPASTATGRAIGARRPCCRAWPSFSSRSIMLLRSCWLSMRRVLVERARHLRVLAHLLGQRLHELVERGAQLVGQLLDLLVAGVAIERVAQRVLRLAQRLFGVGDIAVLDLRPPWPTSAPPLRAAASSDLGAAEIVVDRAQAEIDAGLRRETVRARW